MELGKTSLPIGGKCVVNGDILVYKGPENRKLTFDKEYVVVNCWSSIIQVRCDTCRLVCYTSGWFYRP